MSTTGKIYKESNNVYQDEAKILFNYYQQAAERITAEEERIEKNIQEYQSDKAAVEQKKSTTWKWFLTIVAFWMYWVRNNAYSKQIAAIDAKIKEQELAYKNIFRDYKVTKLGVAYVPVADQIKYEDKSFIVDYAGNVPKSNVTLQMSRQNNLLASTIAQLNHLSENVPIVETSDEPETIPTDQYSLSIQEVTQSDYIGKLDRSMRTIAFCMNDLESSSVDLPLVPDNSEYLAYLQEHATNKLPENATVIDVFDRERFAPSVCKFQDLNKLKDSLSSESQKFEDVLQSLITTVASSVQTISSMKLASTDRMVNSSNALLFRILKAPYNHYSPVLEAEEIQRIREERFDYSDAVQGYDPFTLRESSKVKYNLLTDTWTAEDGSNTSVPFGVHQIYEEIVAPVVQNLMNENRIERLKVYNQIHDQKVSYVNKWHQDVDAFYRSNHAESADIINNMQKTLSEYIEAYNTLAQLKKTEESMRKEGGLDSAIVKEADNSTEVVAAFEMQANEFKAVQDEFSDYMDRLQDDIAQRAEEFGHVEFFDARLRDGYSNEMAIAAGEVAELDDRRKPLAATNPLLAKASELPPAPSVEDLTFEELSMNLTAIAQNALQDLDEMMISPEAEGVHPEEMPDENNIASDNNNMQSEIDEADADDLNDSSISEDENEETVVEEEGENEENNDEGEDAVNDDENDETEEKEESNDEEDGEDDPDEDDEEDEDDDEDDVEDDDDEEEEEESDDEDDGKEEENDKDKK